MREAPKKGEEVFFDQKRHQFYMVNWVETGNNDIPIRTYITLPSQAPQTHPGVLLNRLLKAFFTKSEEGPLGCDIEWGMNEHVTVGKRDPELLKALQPYMEGVV